MDNRTNYTNKFLEMQHLLVIGSYDSIKMDLNHGVTQSKSTE